MLSFLGFGQNVEVKINLNDEKQRKKEEIRGEDGQIHSLPIFYDGETVSGNVFIGIKRGGKLEHQGIKIEFIGQIELYTDRGNREEFIALCQDLARPGILTHSTTYPFEFLHVEKPYESYCGTNVRLRYFLRVTIQKRMADVTKEYELIVHSLIRTSESDDNIKMEVGIDDSLHIEFQYNKSKYHLQDVIIGKIYFLLVRIKIKNMEIQILKRETIGSGPNAFNEAETIAKYEIMDGAPVRGESIPIRLFLQVYGLSPTMRDVHRKFSVRYFLNLLLLDDGDRRYYKQQEILLYRKSDRRRKIYPQNPMPIEFNQQETGGDKSDIKAVDNVETEQKSDQSNEIIANTDTQDVNEGDSPNKLQNGINEINQPDYSNPGEVSNSSHIQSESHLNLNDDDTDSGDSVSAQSRSARSMHRYESKQIPNYVEAPADSVPSIHQHLSELESIVNEET